MNRHQAICFAAEARSNALQVWAQPSLSGRGKWDLTYTPNDGGQPLRVYGPEALSALVSAGQVAKFVVRAAISKRIA